MNALITAALALVAGVAAGAALWAWGYVLDLAYQADHPEHPRPQEDDQ